MENLVHLKKNIFSTLAYLNDTGMHCISFF